MSKREGARFLMSNLGHIVLNSVQKIKKKLSTNFNDRLMAIFGLRIFIATLKMYSQTGWAD